MSISSTGLPGRNQPCICKSGLKTKYCHGDLVKRGICNQVAKEKMVELIIEERKNRGLHECKYTCDKCGAKFDEPAYSELAAAVMKCPTCGDTRITDNENKESGEQNEN